MARESLPACDRRASELHSDLVRLAVGCCSARVDVAGAAVMEWHSVVAQLMH